MPNLDRNKTSTHYKAIIQFWRLSIANQGKSNIDKKMCKPFFLFCWRSLEGCFPSFIPALFHTYKHVHLLSYLAKLWDPSSVPLGVKWKSDFSSWGGGWFSLSWISFITSLEDVTCFSSLSFSLSNISCWRSRSISKSCFKINEVHTQLNLNLFLSTTKY